jgi:hypothetical protein
VRGESVTLKQRNVSCVYSALCSVFYAVMAVRCEACALCRIQYVQHCPFVGYPCSVSPRSGVPRLARVNERLLFSAMEDLLQFHDQPAEQAIGRQPAFVDIRRATLYVLPNKVLESFGVKASPNKTDHGMLVGRLLLCRPPLQ